MKKIIDLLRKFGILHVGSGDYLTGEFDDRKDLKKKGQDNKEKKSGSNSEENTKNETKKTETIEKTEEEIKVKQNEEKSNIIQNPAWLRWIVVLLAVFFFFALWGSGITLWSAIGIAAWGYFLYWLWKGAGLHATTGKVIGLTLAVIVISFVLTDLSAPDAGIMEATSDVSIDTPTDVEGEEIVAALEDYNNERVRVFLETIGKNMDVKVTDVEEAPKTLWTAAKMSLMLTDAHRITLKKMSESDIERLHSLFTKTYGATTGTIGFTFVPPVGTTSAGMVINNQQFSQLMCVLSIIEDGEVEVACGYGPGGEAHLPQARMQK